MAVDIEKGNKCKLPCPHHSHRWGKERMTLLLTAGLFRTNSAALYQELCCALGSLGGDYLKLLHPEEGKKKSPPCSLSLSNKRKYDIGVLH